MPLALRTAVASCRPLSLPPSLSSPLFPFPGRQPQAWPPCPVPLQPQVEEAFLGPAAGSTAMRCPNCNRLGELRLPNICISGSPRGGHKGCLYIVRSVTPSPRGRPRHCQNEVRADRESPTWSPGVPDTRALIHPAARKGVETLVPELTPLPAPSQSPDPQTIGGKHAHPVGMLGGQVTGLCTCGSLRILCMATVTIYSP